MSIPDVTHSARRRQACACSLAVAAGQTKKGSASAEPFGVSRAALASEEQPQQDDHRNRHTQQPKQNSASHGLSLLEINIALITISMAPGSIRATCLPMAGVRHRRPWLLRRQRVAFLKQFDGVQIGRTDEGHLAIARRTVDGDAELHQVIAGGVDVVDLISEMAEITVLAVALFIPVV